MYLTVQLNGNIYTILLSTIIGQLVGVFLALIFNLFEKMYRLKPLKDILPRSSIPLRTRINISLRCLPWTQNSVAT
jgi:hypothetical protein